MPYADVVPVSYDEVLSHPWQRRVVRSILSRDNASTVNEICKDINRSKRVVQFNLNRLLASGLLMCDDDPTDTVNRGRLVYFISYRDESIQDVLHTWFPELMHEGQAKGG